MTPAEYQATLKHRTENTSEVQGSRSYEYKGHIIYLARYNRQLIAKVELDGIWVYSKSCERLEKLIRHHRYF